MTGAERGLLLLCGTLGRTDIRPLSLAQYRELFRRATALGLPDGDLNADVTVKDLLRLGYTEPQAQRILRLLADEEVLDAYLAEAERQGIVPITRISPQYPAELIRKLRLNAPAVLFAKGDLTLLRGRFVSCVGSRDLKEKGRAFAEKVGVLAAKENAVLVSGGANGADKTAQEACLSAGGRVVEVTPSVLADCEMRERVLYLSEDGYDLPFSAQRALARNRIIHAMGDKVLVAQTRRGIGGTWSGTAENLRCGWSPVFICDDGSDGAEALAARGAQPITELESLSELLPSQLCFYE